MEKLFVEIKYVIEQWHSSLRNKIISFLHGNRQIVTKCLKITELYEIESKKEMKALGVIIAPNHIIKRLKFLTKFLTKEELLRLATSQYFSMFYYA